MCWQISENVDSVELDPQEHAFTRTIDEEAELEERADRERDREDSQQEQEDEEEREHEVMTAGSEHTHTPTYVFVVKFHHFSVIADLADIFHLAALFAVSLLCRNFPMFSLGTGCGAKPRPNSHEQCRCP